MLKTASPSKSSRHKVGSRGVLSKKLPTRSVFSKQGDPRTIVLTCAILWSCFLQLSSSSQAKKPILIDSIFSQPDKLQLRFRPMGNYTASAFISHMRIPFDYSTLLQLQSKMIERMDRCIPDLDRFNFNLDQYNRANSIELLNFTSQTSIKSLNSSMIFWPAFHTCQNNNHDNGTSPHSL
jgi:hypothetical protein